MLYNKNIKVTNKNDSSSIIFDMIKDGSVVIDMGCACGDLAEKLVKLKNCKVYGLEYNSESVKKCISKNIFSEVTQFDLNKLSKTSFPQYTNKFDYIIFGDILEHLLSPQKTLSTSLQYLKNSSQNSKNRGNILISLPNLSHASIKANLLFNDFTRTPLGILDKTHLHFFTYNTIASFLAQNHINIAKICYTTLPFDGYQTHKIKELPKSVSKFITQDPHSAIFQYVLECYVDPLVTTKELENCLKNLSVSPRKKSLIFGFKRLLMTKYPNLIQYLEKIHK